eukprot:m.91608 g.91608  ORF g.91608 m.91608 type:complete len:338 (+) comp12333_c0_seq1:206-1219(+)
MSFLFCLLSAVVVAVVSLLYVDGVSGQDISSSSALVRIQTESVENATVIGLFGSFSDQRPFEGSVIAASPFPAEFGTGCDAAEYAQQAPNTTWVALALRGNCTFLRKTMVAQTLGAVGIIVVNNVPGTAVVWMGGEYNDTIIPAVSLSNVDGTRVWNNVQLDSSTRVEVTSNELTDDLWGETFYKHALVFMGMLLVMVVLSFFVYFLKSRAWRNRESRYPPLRIPHGNAGSIQSRKDAIKKLKTFKFSGALKDTQEGSSLDNCAVCLNEYSTDEGLMKLPCGHFFHSECVTEWLERSPTCPLCKMSILHTGENANNGFNNDTAINIGGDDSNTTENV